MSKASSSVVRQQESAQTITTWPPRPDSTATWIAPSTFTTDGGWSYTLEFGLRDERLKE